MSVAGDLAAEMHGTADVVARTKLLQSAKEAPIAVQLALHFVVRLTGGEAPESAPLFLNVCLFLPCDGAGQALATQQGFHDLHEKCSSFLAVASAVLDRLPKQVGKRVDDGAGGPSLIGFEGRNGESQFAALSLARDEVLGQQVAQGGGRGVVGVE